MYFIFTRNAVNLSILLYPLNSCLLPIAYCLSNPRIPE
jgi:hypothetical protein